MNLDDKKLAREAAKLRTGELLRLLRAHPDQAAVGKPVHECEQLERAIDAFHMEAIRFRMYSLDRFIHHADSAPDASLQYTFNELKTALEAAGFQTR